ncbi:MAG: hypothetical protein M1820_008023 [Bogoriella megaspora]|nr:MAG: hypothetical protein M1820_008023 [Bogoriella megaspora]
MDTDFLFQSISPLSRQLSQIGPQYSRLKLALPIPALYATAVSTSRTGIESDHDSYHAERYIQIHADTANSSNKQRTQHTTTPWNDAVIKEQFVGTTYRSLNHLVNIRRQDDVAPARPAFASKRRSKRKRDSPSNVLILALKAVGAEFAVPKYHTGKHDLSFANPRKWQTRSQWKRLCLRIKPSRSSIIHVTNLLDSSPVRLQSIVARYIVRTARLNSELQRASLYRKGIYLSPEIITRAEHTFLEARGYTLTDVKIWAKTLLSRTSQRATIILAACQSSANDAGRRIPEFLILFILRRSVITPGILKVLLVCCRRWFRYKWEMALRVDASSKIPTLGESIDSDLEESQSLARWATTLETSSSSFLIIVRVIRHALKVWPAAVVNIADLAVELLQGKAAEDESEHEHPPRTEQQLAYLSNAYNRILHLLAHPASPNPYHSTVFQQRAQFDILRQMAEHRPALTVTQEGYRSIARVMVAQKKLFREQDWASLKSKSWPPWKVDRTGLDADKDMEYSITRAELAIRRMQEAGYGTGPWDDIVRIYSGWNTDGTPTIQHRFTLRRPPEVVLAPKKLEYKTLGVDRGKQSLAHAWAARIRSTRTVREAWACFLEAREQGLSRNGVVCDAVFEKLIFEEKRVRNQIRRSGGTISESSDGEAGSAGQSHIPLPGDGKEVYAPPISPAESIYLPSEPLSSMAFFRESVISRVQLRDTTVALLVHNAQSLRTAILFYKCHYRAETQPSDRFRFGPEGLAEIGISVELFKSFIDKLCRFSHEPWRQYLYGYIEVRPRSVGNWTIKTHEPLLFALQSLEAMNIPEPIAWNAALRGLTVKKSLVTVLNDEVSSDAANTTIAIILSEQILASMHRAGVDPDLDAFTSLCKIFTNAAHAGLQFRSRFPDIGALGRIPESDAAAIQQGVISTLQKGALTLRSHFKSIVGQSLNLPRRPTHPNIRDTWTPALGPHIPRLLNSPRPYILHIYIRALGVLKDFDGLRELTRWMIEHKSELDLRIRETNGQQKQLRYALMALRTFLERSSCSLPDDEDRIQTLNAIAAECKNLIEGTAKDWGGWPTDAEIDAYCAEGDQDWLQFL